MHRTAAFFAACAMAITAQNASAVTISGTYYEDGKSTNCILESFCLVSFPLSSTITGKLLNVHFVACSGTAPGSLVDGRIFISDTGANQRRTQPLEVVGRQVGAFFNFRNEIEYKVTGGPPRQLDLYVVANASGSFTLYCMITGEITTQ